MRKKLLVIAGFAGAGVFALAVILSLLVDVDLFRPQLERAMTSSLGRRVSIGHISLSVLSASAVVENLTIADDAAFGATPFLKAKSVRVGIAVLPLVFSRRLEVESFRLREPELTLRRSASGAWNFSTLGTSSTAAPQTSDSASKLVLSVDRLAITGGRVAIEAPHVRAGRREYDGVNVEVRDFSSTTRFPFSLSANTPGGGALKLKGTAGPIDTGGIGATPLEATLDAARVDIARSGFVEPGAGLAGLLDARVRVTSDGKRITSSGSFRANKLQLVPGSAPATRPLEAEYGSDFNVLTHEGRLTRGEIRIGNAAAEVQGRVSTRDSLPTVRLTLAGHRMPVVELQNLLPAIGVTLPRGARFEGGTLDVDLAATGRVDRLVIAGPLAMSNATLSGFDLGSQMQRVVAVSGLAKRTETHIESMRVMLRIAPDGIRADALSCVVPSIGSLSGEGTIAPHGAIDFRRVVKLTDRGGMARDVVRVASLGTAEKGVPFRVRGTTASPVFVPDVERAATEAVRNPGTMSKVAGFARSLFKKKR